LNNAVDISSDHTLLKTVQRVLISISPVVLKVGYWQDCYLYISYVDCVIILGRKGAY